MGQIPLEGVVDQQLEVSFVQNWMKEVQVTSLIALSHPWEDFKATGQLDSSL